MYVSLIKAIPTHILKTREACKQVILFTPSTDNSWCTCDLYHRLPLQPTKQEESGDLVEVSMLQKTIGYDS